MINNTIAIYISLLPTLSVILLPPGPSASSLGAAATVVALPLAYPSIALSPLIRVFFSQRDQEEGGMAHRRSVQAATAGGGDGGMGGSWTMKYSPDPECRGHGLGQDRQRRKPRRIPRENQPHLQRVTAGGGGGDDDGGERKEAVVLRLPGGGGLGAVESIEGVFTPPQICGKVLLFLGSDTNVHIQRGGWTG